MEPGDRSSPNSGDEGGRSPPAAAATLRKVSHGISKESLTSAAGRAPTEEELQLLSEQEILAGAAAAEDDDWKSDDLDEDQMDEETRQKRAEQRKKKKDKIKQAMRLKREVTVKKLDKDKLPKEKEKEGLTVTSTPATPAVVVIGATLPKDAVAEVEKDMLGRPTLPRQPMPIHHHLSTVDETSSSQNISQPSLRKTGSEERMLDDSAHHKGGILKSREPSAAPPELKGKAFDPDEGELDMSSGSEGEGGKVHVRAQVIPKPGTRSDSFHISNATLEARKPTKQPPPPTPSPDIDGGTLMRPVNRTLTRGISSNAATLRKPSSGLDRSPSFAAAQKPKKSIIDHLIFAGRHLRSGPPSPALATPTPGTEKQFPSPTPGPAPKLSVASQSAASIPAEDIEMALGKATLPRSPLDSELAPDLPTHAEIAAMKRSDSQSTEIVEGDLGLREDLEEDFDGSDQTYISESEDFQYVRVNLGKLSARGSLVLTEDVLKQLTNQLALSSKEIDNLPNDAFALGKYLESLPKNIVVDLVEDEGGAPFVEVEKVHRSRVLHHTPKAPKQVFNPPKQIRHQDGDTGERSATWIELFYDIFYVAVISKISHTHIISWTDYGMFMSLYVPIWWAWSMVTFYATRFDTDDVLHRVLIFVQMFGITGLAVTVQNAYEPGAVGFIWSFVLIRACLSVQYLIVSFFMTSMRKSILYYLATNLLSVVVFGCSTLVPMPYRIIMWYGSMVIEVIIDFFKFKKVPFNGSHLPERFGLFTIVVLGEVVLQVIEGLSSNLDSNLVTSWVLTGLGIAIAFSLWWIYFNEFSGRVLQAKSRLSNTWLYLHLPLHLFHALLGALISSVLSSQGSVSVELAKIFFLNGAFIFFCNALLKVVLALSEYREEHGITHDFAFAGVGALSRFLMGICLLMCMLIPPRQLTSLVVMGAMLGCCAFQVVADIVVQIFENRYLLQLEEQWEKEDREVPSDFGDDDVDPRLLDTTVFKE